MCLFLTHCATQCATFKLNFVNTPEFLFWLCDLRGSRPLSEEDLQRIVNFFGQQFFECKQQMGGVISSAVVASNFWFIYVRVCSFYFNLMLLTTIHGWTSHFLCPSVFVERNYPLLVLIFPDIPLPFPDKKETRSISRLLHQLTQHNSRKWVHTFVIISW